MFRWNEYKLIGLGEIYKNSGVQAESSAVEAFKGTVQVVNLLKGSAEKCGTGFSDISESVQESHSDYYR